jgi:fumarylpyruvate hydrolase
MTNSATQKLLPAKKLVLSNKLTHIPNKKMTAHAQPELIFNEPARVTLPVAGSNHHFPVGRVFCIGRNYPWEPLQQGFTKEFPSWFMKPSSAVFTAQGVLPFPPETQEFCHEIELVVGIGKGGSNIASLNAEKEHVWGYAVGLDLTRRDLQQHAKKTGGPWEPAKAFDFSAPCSPIVPAATCGPVIENSIWLNVNGKQRQKAKISDLLFSISELISMLSHSVMLQPGDLIFTGTPFGVSTLKPNDLIIAGVDGIAEISMTVGAVR